MARYADPFPQYIGSNGAPLSGAQVGFFLTDTFTRSPTHSDVGLINLNSNPVIADDAGKLPDIFLNASITYRVQVLRADGSLFSQTDDVPGGGVNVTDTGIADWSDSVTYNLPDIVIATDNKTYQALQESLDKDPTLQPEFWTAYTHLKVWNTEENYIINFIVQHEGLLYTSRVANQGFEPDDSPTQWANISSLGPQTIWVPAPAMSPLLTGGPDIGRVETPTNKILIHTLDFDPSSVEAAQFFIQMPSSWDASTINAQIVWSTTSSSETSTAVVWGLRAVAIADEGELDVAFGTQVTIIDTNSNPTAPASLQQTDSLPLIVANAVPGDWVVFEVSRLGPDASDTLPSNARLQGIQLLMTVFNSVDG